MTMCKSVIAQHVILLAVSLYLSSVSHVAYGYNLGVTCSVAQFTGYTILFTMLLCAHMLRWQSISRPWLYIKSRVCLYIWPAIFLTASSCGQELIHPHVATYHNGSLRALHSMDWLVAGMYLIVAAAMRRRRNKAPATRPLDHLFMLATSVACSLCWLLRPGELHVANMAHAAVAFPAWALAKAAHIITLSKIGKSGATDVPADIMVISLLVALTIFLPCAYLSSDSLELYMLSHTDLWPFNEWLQVLGGISWWAAACYFRLSLQLRLGAGAYVMVRQSIYYAAATFGAALVLESTDGGRTGIHALATLMAGIMIACYWQRALSRRKEPGESECTDSGQ